MNSPEKECQTSILATQYSAVDLEQILHCIWTLQCECSQKKNFPPNPLQAHDDSLLKSNFSKKLLLNQLKDDVLCLSKHDNQQSIFYAIITWHVNAILGSYTC